MKKKLLKVMISVLLVTTVMTAMVSVANAATKFPDTKDFNVTATNIDGWGSYDPLTPRAQKSYDGDNKYYVTVTSMSGGCYFVQFYMNHYKHIHENPNNKEYETYLHPMVYLRSSVGQTRTQEYSSSSPSGHYDFLRMSPLYGYCNINCKGRFTP